MTAIDLVGLDTHTVPAPNLWLLGILLVGNCVAIRIFSAIRSFFVRGSPRVTTPLVSQVVLGTIGYGVGLVEFELLWQMASGASKLWIWSPWFWSFVIRLTVNATAVGFAVWIAGGWGESVGRSSARIASGVRVLVAVSITAVAEPIAYLMVDWVSLTEWVILSGIAYLSLAILAFHLSLPRSQAGAPAASSQSLAPSGGGDGRGEVT